MRNWKYKASYSYGENGGNAYVFDLLHVSTVYPLMIISNHTKLNLFSVLITSIVFTKTVDEQHETVKTLRCFFPNIGGCLLPNPGEAIDYQDFRIRDVQVKGEFHLNTYHLQHIRQTFHQTF